uniref:Uncharacterized protein n=1 Tax=Megaselia scalaris TaxID=36166 RepID=T1H2H3_MEGSC
MVTTMAAMERVLQNAPARKTARAAVVPDPQPGTRVLALDLTKKFLRILKYLMIITKNNNLIVFHTFTTYNKS